MTQTQLKEQAFQARLLRRRPRMARKRFFWAEQRFQMGFDLATLSMLVPAMARQDSKPLSIWMRFAESAIADLRELENPAVPGHSIPQAQERKFRNRRRCCTRFRRAALCGSADLTEGSARLRLPKPQSFPPLGNQSLEKRSRKCGLSSAYRRPAEVPASVRSGSARPPTDNSTKKTPPNPRCAGKRRIPAYLLPVLRHTACRRR